MNHCIRSDESLKGGKTAVEKSHSFAVTKHHKFIMRSEVAQRKELNKRGRKPWLYTNGPEGGVRS